MGEILEIIRHWEKCKLKWQRATITEAPTKLTKCLKAENIKVGMAVGAFENEFGII